MAEKQDIPMNAFTPAADSAYIYGEAADGSQVKISKKSLATLLVEHLPLHSITTKVIVERLYVWNIPTTEKGIAIGEVITFSTDGKLEIQTFTSIAEKNIQIGFEKGLPKGSIALAIYSIVA